MTLQEQNGARISSEKLLNKLTYWKINSHIFLPPPKSTDTSSDSVISNPFSDQNIDLQTVKIYITHLKNTNLYNFVTHTHSYRHITVHSHRDTDRGGGGGVAEQHGGG